MISGLPAADLSHKRVFLRADLNVPLIDGHIIDDYRLQALQPTLDLLVNKKAKIILATHIGRPDGKTKKLSTQYLLDWFKSRDYSITWSATLEEAQQEIASGTIVLLENLRFFPEERSGSSEEQALYAKKLKDLAEYYVNDAWAVLHKADTSITLLAQLFKEKTIGLLVEKEIRELNNLRTPQRPYVMILGGAKLSKLSFIEYALTIADTVIVLPALAFTFLKAQGKPVGDSLVDDTLLGKAREIIKMAKNSSVELMLPVDYLVGNKDLKGSLTNVDEIPEGKIGIAVGPKSLEKYSSLISRAKAVFYNGAMGFFERPETLEPLGKLLHCIAQADTYSVFGGGETVAAVNRFHLERELSFRSTGGGATVYYLTYGTLPGLQYF